MVDHPIAWTNCIGKGRMFYSAIGHRPEAYSQPEYVALLEEAMTWAADQKSKRAAGSCTF
jgi:type 1 glutamine amidotransferase